jgi:hypothetical protein
MPYHEPDPTDPSMLVGVGTECTEDELRDMAGCFAGEMAQSGHDPAAIVGLFKDPFYAGPNLAWRALGESEVRRIVDESVEFWNHCRVVVKDGAPCDSGSGRLLWPKPAPANAGGRK